MKRLLTIMSQLVSNLVHKPATIEYGWKVKPSPPPNYRGVHKVDVSKCIGCGLCALDCPAGAIEMVVVGKDERGRPKRLPVIHYYLCIFCYHCVDVCPRKAYVVSNEPPPPSGDKKSLVFKASIG